VFEIGARVTGEQVQPDAKSGPGAMTVVESFGHQAVHFVTAAQHDL
jgi:hypothetical protein